MIAPLTLLVSVLIVSPANATTASLKNCTLAPDAQQCTRTTIAEIKAKVKADPYVVIPLDVLGGLDQNALSPDDKQLVLTLQLQDEILAPTTTTA